MAMSEQALVEAGLAELQEARDLADELHAGCCDPGRSPRMETLTKTLETAHTAISEIEGDRAAAERAVSLLEDAGAQLGFLQVACCTPARTRLYTESLDRLSKTQRMIKRALDLDH